MPSLFPSKGWQHWETNESWQPLQEKYKIKILGTASHETRPEHTSFWGDWKQSHWKTVPEVQLDRVPHFGRSVLITRISLEPTDTDAFRNRSGNIPERKCGKPGNEWGRLPEWSSSSSRHLPQRDYTKLWPRSCTGQTVMASVHKYQFCFWQNFLNFIKDFALIAFSNNEWRLILTVSEGKYHLFGMCSKGFLSTSELLRKDAC